MRKNECNPNCIPKSNRDEIRNNHFEKYAEHLPFKMVTFRKESKNNTKCTVDTDSIIPKLLYGRRMWTINLKAIYFVATHLKHFAEIEKIAEIYDYFR